MEGYPGELLDKKKESTIRTPAFAEAKLKSMRAGTGYLLSLVGEMEKKVPPLSRILPVTL